MTSETPTPVPPSNGKSAPLTGPRMPSHLVGIGASAGGLEALQQFFDHMPSDSGLAFVVIQHLAPDHKSLMVDLLAKHTRMGVVRAEDGMRVEPDVIYLIPPGRNLTIAGGLLRVTPQEQHQHGHGPNLPIDRFFISLAVDFAERAIAVILSGTGSDGTRGVRGIKDAGGTVLVQEATSAKFDGMPRSAIATGLADHIGSADTLPETILGLVRQGSLAAADGSRISPGIELDLLMTQLHEHTGVDFSEYKPSTIHRRIERRMDLNRVDDLRGYLDFLAQNPRELSHLYRDLLISVTRFFRDSHVFEALEQQVIAQVVANHRDQSPIRVWVAGCATGEEAYSLAILFREHLDRTSRDIPVKIFATDLDREAVEFASNGIYPDSVVADLNQERLARFFVQKSDGWQVAKALRDMVVFANHNLLKDPPFHRIDLISCRNLLIYLQPSLQRRVLSLFQFGLVPGGHLVLGSSESLGDLANAFDTIDVKAKIYRVTAIDRPLSLENLHTFRQAGGAARLGGGAVADPLLGVPSEDDLERALVRSVLPACVVVDAQANVIHTVGDISPWLTIPRGRPSLNLMKMAPRELAAVLSVGLRATGATGEPSRYRDVVAGQSRVQVVITAIELPSGPRAGIRLLAVSFEPGEPAGTTFSAEAARDQMDRRLVELERELERTRASLQAAAEEQETANEELQATNEELLASNEELQSTNEELQSVNEELYTVNAEYQVKIGELTEANNDLLNFLSSTNIGTIFLDRNLCIRKFTPAVTEQINLIPQDIGRPLEHITRNILHDDLVKDAEQVLQALVPLTREVRARAGRWYLMRILPYRTEEYTIRGVVITFVDITDVRAVTDDLRKLHAALAEVPVGVLIADANGRVEYVNRTQADLAGYAPEELLKPGAGVPVPGPAMAQVWRTVSAGSRWNGLLEGLKRDGTPYREQATIIPLLDGGRVVNLLKLAVAP